MGLDPAVIDILLTGDRIVVITPFQYVEYIVDFFSSKPISSWVERREEFFSLNKQAVKIVQSTFYNSTSCWDHDLTGEGQVIGLADTVSEFSLQVPDLGVLFMIFPGCVLESGYFVLRLSSLLRTSCFLPE